jgi:hypothetical protein
MPKVRNYILEKYEQAIVSKNDHFSIDLTDYTLAFRTFILKELNARFPYIGYKIRNSQAIFKLDVNASRATPPSYIVAITESFGSTMINI